MACFGFCKVYRAGQDGVWKIFFVVKPCFLPLGRLPESVRDGNKDRIVGGVAKIGLLKAFFSQPGDHIHNGRDGRGSELPRQCRAQETGVSSQLRSLHSLGALKKAQSMSSCKPGWWKIIAGVERCFDSRYSPRQHLEIEESHSVLGGIVWSDTNFTARRRGAQLPIQFYATQFCGCA